MIYDESAAYNAVMMAVAYLL